MKRRRELLLLLAQAIERDRGETLRFEDDEDYLHAQTIMDLLYRNQFVTGVQMIPNIVRGR